jgi:hypothetical protein
MSLKGLVVELLQDYKCWLFLKKVLVICENFI